MLEDSNVLEQFTAEHRSAAQKIKDALHDLLLKIKRALGDKELRLSENQKAAFRDLSGKVNEMETLFSKALETTQEKAGSKNAANLTENRYNDTMISNKYSMKEDANNEREERTYKGTYGNRYENRQESGRRADQGVRGNVSNTSGRYGRINPSLGEKPYFNWAENSTVQPQRGSVADEAQKTAMDYNIPSFVVTDTVWDVNHKGAPAFSVRGQINFRENMPEKNRGMLAPHEITHVMRQAKYQPYLDFIKRTPDMLNLSDDVTKILLEHTAKHQNTTVEKADLMRLYDEFNATVYGHIAANKADMFTSGVASNVFRDFSAYSNELAEIHERFKQDRSSGGEERIRTKKYSLKEYTPEEKKQHVSDAISYFGKTYRWNETGYLTPNGTKLDFSGRHEGGNGGYRTVDHRDIRDA